MMIYIIATGAISILDFGITNIITTHISKYSNENINPYYEILKGKKILTKILCIFILFSTVCVYIFADKASRELYLLILIAIAIQTVFNYVANVIYAINMIESSNIIQIFLTVCKFIIPLIIFHAIYVSVSIYLFIQIIISCIGIYIIMKFIRKNYENIKYKEDFFSLNINLDEVIFLTVLGVLSYLVTNMDKYILKGLVDAKDFSAYSISFMISTVPVVVTSAFCVMHYPKWVHILHSKATFSLNETPKKIAAWSLAYCAILLNFSYDIVFIWTNNITLSHASKNILPILVITQTIQAITMPYFFYSMANKFILINIKILLISLSIFIILISYFFDRIDAVLMAYIYSICILAPMPIYVLIIIRKLKNIYHESKY